MFLKGLALPFHSLPDVSECLFVKIPFDPEEQE